MAKKQKLVLESYLKEGAVEAGCDEAGRGCMAGPVFAAAVIFPPEYKNELINDSKTMSEKKRNELREIIERDALAFAVQSVDIETIESINILNSSILAMHKSLDNLDKKFNHIIVDGNKFKPYKDIEFQTVVKGDGKYLSIAAASILAKTYRDDYMNKIHAEFPVYDWAKNKGYGTKFHREAILKHGATKYHRDSFLNKLRINYLQFGD
jgi:ribonuclease HII